MKFYGTMMCPDTVYADKVLRRYGIEIEYIDITASMKNMKEFARLRDSREEFAPIKENGKMGVPAFLLDDESITFDVHELEGVGSKEECADLEEKEESEASDFKGCSIDGGC